MSGQLSFAELETPGRSIEGLFFAVLPDAASAVRASRCARGLRDEYNLCGRPLAAERLHISLYYLGDYESPPQSMINAAGDAANTVSMPPFKIALDRVVSFGPPSGKRPIVLSGDDGVIGVVMLRQLIDAAMKKAGLGRSTKSNYMPHLTLLYDHHQLPARRVAPIVWTVREFVLLRSLRGRGLYHRLGYFPLSE